jgi:hypothetical protein
MNTTNEQQAQIVPEKPNVGQIANALTATHIWNWRTAATAGRRLTVKDWTGEL